MTVINNVHTPLSAVSELIRTQDAGDDLGRQESLWWPSPFRLNGISSSGGHKLQMLREKATINFKILFHLILLTTHAPHFRVIVGSVICLVMEVFLLFPGVEEAGDNECVSSLPKNVFFSSLAINCVECAGVCEILSHRRLEPKKRVLFVKNT